MTQMAVPTTKPDDVPVESSGFQLMSPAVVAFVNSAIEATVSPDWGWNGLD